LGGYCSGCDCASIGEPDFPVFHTSDGASGALSGAGGFTCVGLVGSGDSFVVEASDASPICVLVDATVDNDVYVDTSNSSGSAMVVLSPSSTVGGSLEIGSPGEPRPSTLSLVVLVNGADVGTITSDSFAAVFLFDDVSGGLDVTKGSEIGTFNCTRAVDACGILFRGGETRQPLLGNVVVSHDVPAFSITTFHSTLAGVTAPEGYHGGTLNAFDSTFHGNWMTVGTVDMSGCVVLGDLAGVDVNLRHGTVIHGGVDARFLEVHESSSITGEVTVRGRLELDSSARLGSTVTILPDDSHIVRVYNSEIVGPVFFNGTANHIMLEYYLSVLGPNEEGVAFGTDDLVVSSSEFVLSESQFYGDFDLASLSSSYTLLLSSSQLDGVYVGSETNSLFVCEASEVNGVMALGSIVDQLRLNNCTLNATDYSPLPAVSQGDGTLTFQANLASTVVGNIDMGGGDDSATISNSSVVGTVSGGSGADSISVRGSSTVYAVDGGSGSDLLEVHVWASVDTAVVGALNGGDNDGEEDVFSLTADHAAAQIQVGDVNPPSMESSAGCEDVLIMNHEATSDGLVSVTGTIRKVRESNSSYGVLSIGRIVVDDDGSGSARCVHLFEAAALNVGTIDLNTADGTYVELAGYLTGDSVASTPSLGNVSQSGTGGAEIVLQSVRAGTLDFASATASVLLNVSEPYETSIVSHFDSFVSGTGDDAVRLDTLSTPFATVSIDLGAGNDYFEAVSTTIAASATIDMGDGGDQVQLDGDTSIAGTIDLGTGASAISFASDFTGSLGCTIAATCTYDGFTLPTLPTILGACICTPI